MTMLTCARRYNVCRFSKLISQHTYTPSHITQHFKIFPFLFIYYIKEPYNLLIIVIILCVYMYCEKRPENAIINFSFLLKRWEYFFIFLIIFIYIYILPTTHKCRLLLWKIDIWDNTHWKLNFIIFIIIFFSLYILCVYMYDKNVITSAKKKVTEKCHFDYFNTYISCKINVTTVQSLHVVVSLSTYK